MRPTFVFVLTTCIFWGGEAYGQLKGDHLLGQTGLQSGTQGPPGINLVVLPAYVYTTKKLKNDKGNVVNVDFSVTSYVGAPGVSWVLPQKILGANIGGSALFPFASNKIESNLTNVKTSLAYSDSYLQPIQLGWHGKHADFTAGFGLYIPTGKYSQGGDDNSGLGMWAYEFSAGTTVFMDAKKEWHVSTLLSYELNSSKKGTDVKAGDLLSIEGGLGRTFYKKTKGPIPVIINAGLAYYMQYKTSNDKIPTDSLGILGGKDHIYGLGAEGNIFLPSIKSMFALRWIAETGAVNRMQGNTYVLMWVYKLK